MFRFELLNFEILALKKVLQALHEAQWHGQTRRYPKHLKNILVKLMWMLLDEL
jgi:hypothetical protein